MYTRIFWKDALERAIKTAAQAVLTVYLVGDVALDVFATDWYSLAGIALGGAFASVLTSIASTRIGDDSPSLIDHG